MLLRCLAALVDIGQVMAGTSITRRQLKPISGKTVAQEKCRGEVT